ncbi:hypothetical protein [Winogradskya consettensis]|nr:hypothetical protein [Actinoplanes consettensis]
MRVPTAAITAGSLIGGWPAVLTVSALPAAASYAAADRHPH